MNLNKQAKLQYFEYLTYHNQRSNIAFHTSIKATKKNLEIKSEFSFSLVSTETIREAVVQRCSVKNYAGKFIKKRLWHRCFPVNFAKTLRTPFLQNTSDGCFCHQKNRKWFRPQKSLVRKNSGFYFWKIRFCPKHCHHTCK